MFPIKRRSGILTITKTHISDSSLSIARYVGKEERGLLWCNSRRVPLRRSDLPLVGSRPALPSNFPSNSILGKLPTHQYIRNELPFVKHRIAKNIQIGAHRQSPRKPSIERYDVRIRLLFERSPTRRKQLMVRPDLSVDF
jgi:hypothetical protein